MHPEVGWISTYLQRFPWCPPLSALNRVVHIIPSTAHAAWFLRSDDADAIGRGKAHQKRRRRWLRFAPKPNEGEAIYASCNIPDFPSPAWNITEAQTRCLHAAFDRIRRYQGAARFVSDRTANNWRLLQILAAFPSARFIHIIRDGRAVAHSALRADWWNDHEMWWLNRQTPRQWEENGGRPLELAARNWVEEMREIEKGVRAIPAPQVMQVRYEELILSTFRDTLQRIAGFLDLPSDRSWLERVSGARLYDGNAGSLRSMGPEEERLLLSIQGPTLARHGYS